MYACIATESEAGKQLEEYLGLKLGWTGPVYTDPQMEPLYSEHAKRATALSDDALLREFEVIMQEVFPTACFPQLVLERSRRGEGQCLMNSHVLGGTPKDYFWSVLDMCARFKAVADEVSRRAGNNASNS